MRFRIKTWWNVLCWTGILSLPLAVSGCNSSTFVTMSGGSSTSISVSNDRTTVKIKKPEYELELECKGKWTFASDESDFASGDPNTKAELIEVSNGIRQSYRIESDSNGELTRSYWRAGKLVEMDEAASAWIKDAIARLFSESSFQAKERTERMLSEGQEEKLFAAIEASRDQFTKSIYLQSVVEYSELNLELFEKTIQFSRKMNSDFDRAELLNKAAKRLSESKDYQQAWLKGLEEFQSDFDLARVIRNALGEKRLDKSFVESLMTIAAEKMKSDFELKGTLVEMSSRVEEFDLAKAYAQATMAIESDFERMNALSSLVQIKKLNKDAMDTIWQSISTMKSDFEKAAVLKEFVRHHRNDESVRQGVEKIAGGMSDFEKQNVLNTLK